MTLTSELERAHPPAAPGEASLTSRRLSILTRREIDDLYGLPRFTEEDQQLYFDLSAAEEARVRAMHTDSAKVHFVLQLGYFKAKRQFFVYACNEVQEDLRHILERHFPGRALATIRELSKPTRLEQQQVILNLFNYKRCGKAAKQDLERKAGRIAMRSTQPVYILREVLQYLAARRIVAPGYTISPVAWRHVNLIGRFEFNKAEKVDLDALVRIFEEPECWTRIMREQRLDD